jgi:hypothetical protein
MDYGEILVTAWKIIWKNKILWLFGLLIGFSQAISAGNQVFQIIIQSDLISPAMLRSLVSIMDVRTPGFWIGLVLLTCGLMIFLVILTSIGQTGILRCVVLADGAENQRVSFGDLIKALKTYFWRIFGLSLVVDFGFLFIFLGLYAVFLVAVMGGFFATRGSGSAALASVLLLSLICLLPLLCIFVLIGWVISAWLMFALVAIVNDDLGILASLRQGFNVLKQHFWKILLLVLIIGVIGGLIGALLAMPLSATSFVPLMSLGNGRLSRHVVWISLIFILVYTPIMVFVFSVLSVYMQAIWALAYRRLTKPAETPALAQPTVEPAHG